MDAGGIKGQRTRQLLNELVKDSIFKRYNELTRRKSIKSKRLGRDNVCLRMHLMSTAILKD